MRFPKMISVSGGLFLSALLFLSPGTNRVLGAAAGQNSGPAASNEDQLPVSTGKLDFQTDQFSGRFGYSVPIVAPPARNGSEPSLALRYTSSGDNGWIGQGWELEIGYIQRETRKGVPVKWTSGIPQSEYDDGKGFVFSLNGASSRLINVATNEFRAEIESGFLKFNYLTNSGGNSWLVTDTGGNKFYFGETADSRMVNTKWGSNTNLPKGTFRWALNRSQTITGTTNQFIYQIISGAQYPHYINYNGHVSGIVATNQIEFLLETTNRVDTRVAYNSGFKVETSRRLSKIYCRVGSTVVRRYDLAYTNSPSTFRSLLASVTQIGLNESGSLPPVTFQYQQQTREYQSVAWTNIVTHWTSPAGNSSTPDEWRFPTASLGGGVVVDLVDMDGDALPDRLLRSTDTNYPSFYLFQRNTGSGFASLETNRWGLLTTQVSSGGQSFPLEWNYIMGNRSRLVDLNGDGRPDHVVDPIEAFFNAPNDRYTNFVVDINTGTGWTTSNLWAGVIAPFATGSPNTADLQAIENSKYVKLIDMNGDGLPDRVLQHTDTQFTYTNWWVQFNTGSGFTGLNAWYPISSQGATIGSPDWWGIDDDAYSLLVDINGDGLPDRVMAPKASGSTGIDYSNFNRFVVQFNNGYGFEPEFNWVNVNFKSDFTGGSTTDWSSIETSGFTALRDMNGDGLPDRVLGKYTTPFTKFYVQFNTGNVFATNLFEFTSINSQGNPNDRYLNWIEFGATNRMVDINADGLADRVMVVLNGNYLTNWFVADLAKGPFPDLMTVVSNGIGGSIKVSYDTSAKFQNRETTDVSSKGLLPFPSRVVTSVATSDGLYPYYTNFFGYEGGYYDPVRREFAGFHFVSTTNTLGQVTQTWFHQGGGRDDASLGEFEDDGNFAKRGIPFRTQNIGTNGEVYQLSINKADQYAYGSTDRYFAFVSQNTRFDYPGTGADPRATASSTLYDTTNGNVTNTIAWGEVTNFVATNHVATDVTTDDDVYQWTTYASLSNPDILNKPLRSWTTSDSGASSVLGESLFTYDGSTGNLLRRLDSLCPDNCYETNWFAYNSYGNLTITTNEAGIVTTTDFDSTKTFPVTETTASFVSSFLHDTKSGVLLWSKAASGLVSSNQFDTFFRLTNSWVSASSNGTPGISLERRSYNLGGIASGSSANYVKVTQNDTTSDNPASGLDSYTYSDGLGRVIQTRAESETNNTYRVSQTVYDERGAVKVVTQPVFLTGTSYTVLGTANMAASVNEYDPIGRLKKTTSPMNVNFNTGQVTNTPASITETGSLIGSLLIAYNDGSDPWTRVVTDESGTANGLVRKFGLDGFGRTNVIYDVFNGTVYATNRLAYDRLGRMTNLVDAAGNQIQYAYNDLGQMIAMADPNLGFWQYQRDYAGRVKEQIDGKGNTVDFEYDDPLGRLSVKTVTPAGGGSGYSVSYDYDTTSGSGFTVYPGQLAKVTDNAGTERYSYDVRGRTLKVTRDLSVNSQSYTNQFLFDNADRQISVSYPASGPTVTNRYDAGGNLTQVQRVDAGGNTTYFQSKGYSQLQELLGATFGNGTEINYTYFTKTRRLQNLASKKTNAGTNFQALAYTYNEVGDIKSITDSLYATTNSATMSSIGYDNLHRLTSLTRPGPTTTTFTYNALGNMLSNGEQGGSTYVYPTSGILPHAVRIVGTKTNAYDLVGNMTFRAGQSLGYDPENRLTSVVSGGVTLATFGYADGGDRLWKQSTNTLSVWIGDLYEAHGTTNLFHIFAGSRRIATYSPGTQLPGAGGTTTAFNYYHPDHLGSSSLMTDGNGAVAEHYEYSAYGRERANGTAAPDASHRFTGQIFDAEVGLYYYGARYYDADLGRFIQADTIIPDYFDPQSWNRYAYANNNPIKYTDPTGHEVWDYIPGIGPGARQTQGNNALDQMVKDWSARTGRQYDSYHEYMNTRNGATGTATAGDLGKISGIGQITAGAADVYLNGAMGLGEAGIAAGVGAGIRATAERKGATAGAEKGLEKSIPEASNLNSLERTGAKRGPKVDPTAPHNATIRAEAEKLRNEGNAINAGGGGKEKLIPTPGGIKEGRRPDILYKTPEGEVRARNVGKTRADGTPVKREVDALKDLNGPGGVPTDFKPYDR
ncbi:hypothetical protein GC207_02995 [bacterium]|nr:hypothetical protein [bacterium]